jgi:very-short-patch-repair endonuclease
VRREGMPLRGCMPSLFTLVQFARQHRGEPTRSEAMLWREIRGRKLGAYFRRQHPLGGAYIVDFACTTQRLVVEIDGGIHRAQREQDGRRQRVLGALGWRFVRIEAELVERATSRRRWRSCGRRCADGRHPTCGLAYRRDQLPEHQALAEFANLVGRRGATIHVADVYGQ